MGVEPVELTQAEVNMLKSLASHIGEPVVLPEPVEDQGWREEVRQIVRAEIASLAGLALRRTQDRDYTRDPERNLALDVANTEAAQFWGEVLAEYAADE